HFLPALWTLGQDQWGDNGRIQEMPILGGRGLCVNMSIGFLAGGNASMMQLKLPRVVEDGETLGVSAYFYADAFLGSTNNNNAFGFGGGVTGTTALRLQLMPDGEATLVTSIGNATKLARSGENKLS